MLLSVELRNLSAQNLEQLREHGRQPGAKIMVQAVIEDIDDFGQCATVHCGSGFTRILDEDLAQRMSLRSRHVLWCNSSLGQTSSSGSSGEREPQTLRQMPPPPALPRAKSGALSEALRSPPPVLVRMRPAPQPPQPSEPGAESAA